MLYSSGRMFVIVNVFFPVAFVIICVDILQNVTETCTIQNVYLSIVQFGAVHVIKSRRTLPSVCLLAEL